MSLPNWWGDWRQNLTPHTGDLQPTDLIECTQIVAGQPVNTAITGQQIINAASGGGATWGGITGTLSNQTDLNTALNGKQATLVSGSNIKTVNNNSLVGSGNVNLNPKALGYSASVGSLSVSTGITISKFLLIPANTLTSDTLLEIQWRLIRVTGNTGQMHTRLYINTANNLTGATLISGTTSIVGSSTQYAIKCEKTITCRANGFSWMASTSNEFAASTINAYNLNRAVDQYLLFTVQSTVTGETCYVDFYRVLQYA